MKKSKDWTLDDILHAKPDTLVVLGGEPTKKNPDAPETKLFRRSDYAVFLFEQIKQRLGYEPNIICTGYKSGLNPKQVLKKDAEAEKSKKYLIEHGVPEEKIKLEVESQDALTNMIYSWNILEKLNSKVVGFVNEPDDMHRVVWTAERVYGDSVQVIPCPTPEKTGSLLSVVLDYIVCAVQGFDLFCNGIKAGDHKSFQEYATTQHPFTGSEPGGLYNVCCKIFPLLKGTKPVKREYDVG